MTLGHLIMFNTYFVLSIHEAGNIRGTERWNESLLEERRLES